MAFSSGVEHRDPGIQVIFRLCCADILFEVSVFVIGTLEVVRC